MTTPTRTAVAAGALLAIGIVAGWSASNWRRAEPETRAAPPPAAAASAERKVLYWYDPMLPTQKFDKPGKSPFMDMQLVPRYADEAADAGPGVGISAAATQSLGLRTVVAERMRLAPVIDVVGNVALNEREVAIVQARAGGFVERVYALAPGDVVAAGAALADLLHPEWLAAQQEFLAVRATGDAALAAAARQRLVLLGMPAAVIERVEQSGQPQPVTTVTAPIGGVVAELMVRQGMTVAGGMTLARLNGLASVWVEAAVPEALVTTVAPGQTADVRLAGEATVRRGRVAAVLPEANRDTRTLRVRIELANPGGRLRPGLSAQVRLQAGTRAEQTVLPAEAVIRTGRRAIVYLVGDDGRYRPVEVEIGDEVDGRIVIRRGVEPGQTVVASGQFLIDSEASLQGLTAAPAASGARP